MSVRENVLAAFHARLASVADATVLRNAALPAEIPAGGLIVMRDGNAGAPDITLNPVTMYFAHAIEIEAFVTQPVGGGGEAALDALLTRVATALAADRTLGGQVEWMMWAAPETTGIAIEGGAPVMAATTTVVVEYLVSDPLAS